MVIIKRIFSRNLSSYKFFWGRR